MNSTINPTQGLLVEENELTIGSNFHAFNFSSPESTSISEWIELVDEEELTIGSNFHAFHFSAPE